jgi:hypothetical protein
MKFVKSLLIGTGSVVLAGFVLTLLAPKAVHAVVATAVQVMNTSANPVPNKDVDQPGRHPYTTGCSHNNAPTASEVTCDTVATPVTSELVIQGVNLFFFPSGTAVPTFLFVQVVTNGTTTTFNLASVASPDGIYYFSALTTPLYADPGSTITCGGASVARNFQIPGINCTVTGYLVSVP